MNTARNIVGTVDRAARSAIAVVRAATNLYPLPLPALLPYPGSGSSRLRPGRSMEVSF
jgi:hypothetical protein